MKKFTKLFQLFAFFALSACDVALSDSVNPYSKAQSGGFTYYDATKNEFRIYYKGPMGQSEADATQILKQEAINLAKKNNSDWYIINNIEARSMRKNYYKYSQEEQAQKDKSLSPQQIKDETNYYISAYLIIGSNPAPQGAVSVK